MVHREPDILEWYENDDPYCCRFCPDADGCDPAECELLEQEKYELRLQREREQ